MELDEFVLAQASDLHFGDKRCDTELAYAIQAEINELQPDLVVIAGDLTEAGYREQFEEAAVWFAGFTCPNRVVIPGNHDVRNVGYLHYAEFFGAPYSSQLLHVGGQSVRVVGVDTAKPDLNQGELGRGKHLWLYDEFTSEADLKILALHHHLVSVPGTGRERNILWDAGDILEILSETGVDLVLCGHKHVPYAWEVNGMAISTSGTACTRRTRGRTPPSFSIVRVTPEETVISMRNSGLPTGRTASIPRRSAVQLARPQRGRQAAEIEARVETVV